jgi:hypothetical protein
VVSRVEMPSHSKPARCRADETRSVVPGSGETGSSPSCTDASELAADAGCTVPMDGLGVSFPWAGFGLLLLLLLHMDAGYVPNSRASLVR